jgi:hypothetical protein
MSEQVTDIQQQGEISHKRTRQSLNLSEIYEWLLISSYMIEISVFGIMFARNMQGS